MSKDIATIYDWSRMCKTIGDDCPSCPIHNLADGKNDCFCYMIDHPEESTEAIIEWCEEHPVKTYTMDFYEKFPDATRSIEGVPMTCRKFCYSGGCPVHGNCVRCWNEPMEVE